MDEALRAYHHEPMNPRKREIRLVKLCHDLDHQGLIRCDIFTFRLAIAPDYQALSYEWGSSSPLRKIRVGDQLMLIRENLWHFLNLFRSKPANDTLLWIDQMSINQDDDHERAEQVRLMGDIYSKATNTVAWLGLSAGVDTSVDIVLEKHGYSAGRRRSLAEAIELCTDEGCTVCAWRRHNAFILSCERGLQILSIRGPKRLWDLSYWRRIWIVQENVLAADCMFWLGEHQYKRSDILQYPRIVSSVCRTIEGEPHMVGPIEALLDPSLSSRNATIDQVLVRYASQYTQCSDPHDLVYGFLGLVGSSHRIHVCYQSALSCVFEQLMDVVILSPTLQQSLEPPEPLLTWHLAFLGRHLGLTPRWARWLGCKRDDYVPWEAMERFLACLVLLEHVGLDKTRWSAHELGSIIHTVRQLEYSLLPLRYSVLYQRYPASSPEYIDALGLEIVTKKQLDGFGKLRELGRFRYTVFVEAVNQATSSDLQSVLAVLRRTFEGLLLSQSHDRD